MRLIGIETAAFDTLAVRAHGIHTAAAAALHRLGSPKGVDPNIQEVIRMEIALLRTTAA